jgi:hypothetical protein
MLQIDELLDEAKCFEFESFDESLDEETKCFKILNRLMRRIASKFESLNEETKCFKTEPLRRDEMLQN